MDPDGLGLGFAATSSSMAAKTAGRVLRTYQDRLEALRGGHLQTAARHQAEETLRRLRELAKSSQEEDEEREAF